jgi:outer membrane lipoprotein carrier protein
MKIFMMMVVCIASLWGNNLKAFKTIQSDFVQKVTNDQNKTITYTGQFYATHDKKALWVYEKPVAKKIYFNNTKVVIIEPELEQAIITNLENTPNIAQLITQAKEVAKETYATSFMETTYTIYATPTSIDKVTYNDKLDNSVEILFSNQSTNLFLEDTLFQADIPLGFDLIRQ